MLVSTVRAGLREAARAFHQRGASGPAPDELARLAAHAAQLVLVGAAEDAELLVEISSLVEERTAPGQAGRGYTERAQAVVLCLLAFAKVLDPAAVQGALRATSDGFHYTDPGWGDVELRIEASTQVRATVRVVGNPPVDLPG